MPEPREPMFPPPTGAHEAKNADAMAFLTAYELGKCHDRLRIPRVKTHYIELAREDAEVRGILGMLARDLGEVLHAALHPEKETTELG